MGEVGEHYDMRNRRLQWNVTWENGEIMFSGQFFLMNVLVACSLSLPRAADNRLLPEAAGDEANGGHVLRVHGALHDHPPPGIRRERSPSRVL